MENINIQVLVATMNKTNPGCINLYKKMNLSTSAVIINQASFMETFSKSNLTIISVIERGLSNSRNMALNHSTEEVCVLADDDIEYVSEYEEIIKKAYLATPDADIIIFDYDTNDNHRKCTKLGKKIKKIGLLNSLKVSSVRITFKRKSIVVNDLKFDTNFGAGARFPAGEENIFLIDCLNAGLKIYYNPQVICKVTFDKSSWFNGYNEIYFKTKGAFAYKVFNWKYNLYIIQFIFRKHKRYKSEISALNAYKFMLKGISEYKNILCLN